MQGCRTTPDALDVDNCPASGHKALSKLLRDSASYAGQGKPDATNVPCASYPLSSPTPQAIPNRMVMDHALGVHRIIQHHGIHL